MPLSGDPLFLLNAADVYEGVERYAAVLSDFHDVVAPILPAKWELLHESMWVHCTTESAQRSLPVQGWKIHLSVEIPRAADLLRCVVPELISRTIVFKFAADKQILYLLNCKHWSRGGGGKFVTIYPPTEEAFRELADRLVGITAGFNGPYILSDRRYHGSKTVYYRFGGFQKLTRFNNMGGRDNFIITPSGQWIEDTRHAYFHLPEWLTDPFSETDIDVSDPYPDNTLHKGRFLIDKALIFTNAGGVYMGTDTFDGAQVLIKESRPYVYMLGTQWYTTDLLAREHEMLSRLAPLGVAPKPVAHFIEWEHHYLVEEFVEGDTIARHWAAINILLFADSTPDEFRRYHEKYYRVAIALCRLLDTLHNNGIVFGDLSPNNIMMNSDATALKVIDMESAALHGEVGAPSLYTPGFGKRSDNGLPAPVDDYFAVGSVLAFMLFPFNRLFTLDESVSDRVIPEAARDSGFPKELPELILSLMGRKKSRILALSDAVAQIERLAAEPGRPSSPVNTCSEVEPEFESSQIAGTVDALISFIFANLDYSRGDRFFPAASDVLWRNPYCLGNGLAGLAEMLLRARGEIPEEMRDCLARVGTSNRELPAGLFAGQAGISQVMWDCGLSDEAIRLAHAFATRPDRFASPFYENGIAGLGVTALYLYSKSGDKGILAFAEQAAAQLLEASVITEQGYSWPVELQDYGLGRGSSGIALFLLYMYLVTGNGKYRDAGEEALRFDLASGKETRDGGLAWEHLGSDTGVLYPYWLHGSAGVGEVVLRYFLVTRRPFYREALAKISKYVCRKYAVLPGFVDGLCGLGHFVLNCAVLLKDPDYHRQAKIIATGLNLHFLRRPEGLAVCGDGRGRISCDYSTGSAGVITFLLRLVNSEPFSLFPDDLISENAIRRADDSIAVAGVLS